jgi:hypothetical protein
LIDVERAAVFDEGLFLRDPVQWYPHIESTREVQALWQRANHFGTNRAIA